MTPHERARRRDLAALLSIVVLATLVAAPVTQAADHVDLGGERPDPLAPGQEVPPITDQVIVRYARGASASDRQAVRDRNRLTRLASTPDGRLELLTAPGRSTATVRRVLAEHPAVVATAVNGERELADDITDEPYFDDLWGMHNTGQAIRGSTGTAGIDIDVPQAQKLLIGRSSTVVAVIDEGIDFSHPDLAERAWVNPGEAGAKATNGEDDDGNGYVDDVHGWDFCNDDNTVHDTNTDAHGTHVAGTIAASLDGQGIAGVAPGVKLMSLKTFEASRACPFGDFPIIEAIDYAAAMGVHIINASWGSSYPNDLMDDAIAASDALFVAAAGNDGRNIDSSTGQRFYPAASTVANVISVGAADKQGRRASFSNYGTKSVDLAAPGADILSTIPPRSDCPAPCYAWASGTSMAAPHVAGVAALVGSRESVVLNDPIRMKKRLMDRGRALPNGTAWTLTGRMVNAHRSVDAVGPVVSPPDRFAVKTGSTIGSTVPVTVMWPAATDTLSTVSSYRLDRTGPSGTTRVATDLTTTSAKASVTVGSSYVFGVSALDSLRNVGGPAKAPAVIATQHSEASILARYSSGWRRVASPSAMGGNVSTTSSAAVRTAFKFTGRSVALVMTKGPDRGAVKVHVDGVYKTTVDLERSSVLARTVVYSTWWTDKAEHEVLLITVDKQRVDVDGWVVVR